MAVTRRKSMAPSKPETSPPPPPSTPPQISPTNEEQPQPESEPAVEAGSNYEQFREQRIKENLERMQKLGIVDLSLKLKSMAPSRRTPRPQSERKTPLKLPLLGSSEPRRRSSRLQNVTPVTYTEPKEDKSKRGRDILLEEGAKPEVYTEEHEKLLGNTEMPWTFFSDGYRADGTRIYDPVNGKTCHQCRQKTMGMRTRCSKCNLVQGQFCGDCLYMRYGEHVVEANQNPNWTCPPCRGICNCSLCRQARGWPATGTLYKKIASLGFKSVAHYLITTKRAPPSSEKSSDSDTTTQCANAKRSLPFDGMEVADHEDDVPRLQGAESDDQVEKTEEVNPDAEENQPSEKTTKQGRGRSRQNSGKEDANANVNVNANEEVNPNAEENEPSEKTTKRGRGRPRKDFGKEDADNLNAEENEQSEKTTRRGRGRPRKDFGKEDADNLNAEENEQSEKTTKRGRGRPRKDSGKEDADADANANEESQPNEKSTKRSVGRLRKKPRKEDADANPNANAQEDKTMQPETC